MIDENEKRNAEYRKEKIAAMKGAQATMREVIDQMEEMEFALTSLVSIVEDISKMVGKDALIRSHYGSSEGCYSRDARLVSVENLVDHARYCRARVTSR